MRHPARYVSLPRLSVALEVRGAVGCFGRTLDVTREIPGLESYGESVRSEVADEPSSTSEPAIGGHMVHK